MCSLKRQLLKTDYERRFETPSRPQERSGLKPSKSTNAQEQWHKRRRQAQEDHESEAEHDSSLAADQANQIFFRDDAECSSHEIQVTWQGDQQDNANDEQGANN